MRLAVCVTALLTAACSAGSPSSGELNADKLTPLALVEELRIGSRDNPDTGFASILGVDVDRDGNVYAYEQQQGAIRVYDPRGKLLRTIGRRGSGPGEFQRFAMFWVVGDTIWTYEPRSAAGLITLFNREGEVLATGRTPAIVRLGPARTLGMILPRRARDDGVLVARTNVSSEELGDTVSTPRILIDPTGAVVDTIGWDRWTPQVPREYPPPVSLGGTTYHVPAAPDSAAPSASLEDGRLVVAFAPAGEEGAPMFTVSRLGEAGDTVFHRRFRYSPKRYDGAMLDSMAWSSARIPGGEVVVRMGERIMPPMRSDSMAAFAAVRAAIRFPEYQRPVQGILVQRDGTFWLRREDDGASATRWMVLGADGRARGELNVPKSVDLAWSGGDTVWGIERDDLDVPWLVRYRIAERGAGQR
jgi:hypothetical protein